MLATMDSMVQLLALVFTALALVPGAAHVIELPNKLPMPRDAYLTVQKVYRGWQFAGIAVGVALLATLWLAIDSEGRARLPSIIAFLAIVGTQVVFWLVTYPVNRRTANWTLAPEEDWERLRDRWELSHAASALLNFVALVCVAMAILTD
jgi:Domain of unknown function (DUF1772)